MFSRFTPSNATPLERDLEIVTLHWLPTEELITLWNPSLSPAQFIPWLAWSLHVDYWDPLWLEATKRKVLAESIEIHKKKGTLWAIKKLLDTVGVIDYSIVEWFQEQPMGVPHTFNVELGSSPGLDPYVLDETQYSLFRRLIETTKPSRSLFYFRVRTNFGNKEPHELVYDGDEFTGEIRGNTPFFAHVADLTQRQQFESQIRSKLDDNQLLFTESLGVQPVVETSNHVSGELKLELNPVQARQSTGCQNIGISEQIVKQEVFCSTSDQLNTVPSYFGPASVLEGIQVVRSEAEFRVVPNKLVDELGNYFVDEFGDNLTDYSLSNFLIDELGNYFVDELGNNLSD